MDAQIQRVADHVSIVQLCSQFAWLIDHKDGKGVPNLFSEDGRYGSGDKWCTGRAEIEQFYLSRAASGTRKSRHVFTNHLISQTELDGAECRSILLLFATDGDPQAAALPLAVMDYDDILVRTGSGWLFKERHVSHRFGTMPNLLHKK